MAHHEHQLTWHRTIETALGELTLVRDAEGLTGIYFPHHWHRPDPGTFGAALDRGFDETAHQISEYLDGQRQHFDVPLHPSQGDPLQTAVWASLGDIPYGTTTTYGELARRIGGELTAQQVGAAVGRNPLSIVVPCHRVVGSNGKLTGYAGGLARKRRLLDLEYANATRLELISSAPFLW